MAEENMGNAYFAFANIHDLIVKTEFTFETLEKLIANTSIALRDGADIDFIREYLGNADSMVEFSPRNRLYRDFVDQFLVESARTRDMGTLLRWLSYHRAKVEVSL